MSMGDMVIVTAALMGGFGLVVFIHELGHFLLARRAGITVEVFSIGFGPQIVSFTRGGTRYQWSLLPLGGYVKMVGEDPTDEAGLQRSDGFSKVSVWDRFLVIIAGPAMNILLACLLMPLVFLLGRERPVYEQQVPVIEHVARNTGAALAGLHVNDRITSINGMPVSTWEGVQDALVLAGGGDVSVQIDDNGRTVAVTLPQSYWGLGIHPLGAYQGGAVVGEVSPDMPAAQAGLRTGDYVTALAGFPIENWSELSVATSKGRSLWFWLWARQHWGGDFTEAASYLSGGPMAVDVLRDGAAHRMYVEPQYNAEVGRYLMGVNANTEAMWDRVPMEVRRHGFGASVQLGMGEVARMLSLTGKFVVQLFATPQDHVDSLAGPVRIVSMFAEIAREGLSPFIFFLAFFNLQLGLLNLMPLPVLDGGHLVFLTIEALRGKPLSQKAQAIAQRIGLSLLLTLFIVVTLNDLSSFAWMKSLKAAVFGP